MKYVGIRFLFVLFFHASFFNFVKLYFLLLQFNACWLWHLWKCWWQSFCAADNQEAQCGTLNCSFNCKLTPQGPKCYCAAGQVPVNGTQCMDFDECSIEGMCDQQCRNTPGSYECSCVAGYVKQNNHCVGVNGKF